MHRTIIMQLRVRNAAGTVMLLSGLPAFAQPSGQSSAASEPPPPTPPYLNVPSDPTWFVAGFVTGLVVGAIGAKVLGGFKSNSPG
jgi:hypothetical protein